VILKSCAIRGSKVFWATSLDSMTRKRRARGLARMTILAFLAGIFLSMTLIASLTVATDRPLPAPRGLAFAHTNGFETRFEQWGSRSSHPIVLLHGAFESVAIWEPVARLLAAKHHVEAYDLKGYGYTTHVGPYTTAALVRQLYDFLRVRHLRQPILVGHSLGAGVIAQFVLDHPRVAAGIVFLDGDGLQLSYPGGALMKAIPSLYFNALYQTLIRSGFLIRTIFEAACGPGCPPFTNKVLSDIQGPLKTIGAQQALVAYAQHPIVGVTLPRLKAIRRFHIPSLVIFGEKDSSFSSQAAFMTAQRLGAPSPIIIKNAGHLSLWSHPMQVAKAIADFWASFEEQPSHPN
jgi:pimeloyl-ACP methyl ester carboxylesterase